VADLNCAVEVLFSFEDVEPRMVMRFRIYIMWVKPPNSIAIKKPSYWLVDRYLQYELMWVKTMS